VLQCVEVCCNVLQCVAIVLQCVATVLQFSGHKERLDRRLAFVAGTLSYSVLECVADVLQLCYSALPCVAVCCSVLQCIAAVLQLCCSVLLQFAPAMEH